MQLDDVPHIVHSRDLHDIRDVGRWWHHDPRRPIGYMTLALNYSFSKLNVGSYHAVNLAIHILNACLVYWLVQLTLSTPVVRGRATRRQKNAMALFAGLLFLTHSIQTEAVTYIVQRLASQATMFYLLAVALYARGRLWQGGPLTRVLWFVGAAVSGALGMLTKEIVFTLPLAIALYEFSFLYPAASPQERRRLVWLAVIGAGALLIIPALMSFDLSKVFRAIPPDHGNPFTLTPYTYALTQLRVVVTYLRLLVFPINQNLDYDIRISSSLLDWQTLGSFLVLAGLLAVGIRMFRTRRVLSFGMLWFFLTLSVESTFVPIADVLFEYRLYLPMFGFCLVVVELLIRLGMARAVALLSLAVAGLGIATYRRNDVWRDPVTLWADAARKAPNKARPHTNVGKAYLDRGQLDLAEHHLKRAVEINPEYALGHMNLGGFYQRRGLSVMAERHLTRAAELPPTDARMPLSLGMFYVDQGRATEAEAPLMRAIAIDSTVADAHSHLGMSWYMRGDDDQAIRHSGRAVELDPRRYEALNNLGRAWRRRGDFKRAREYYEEALDVEPQSTEVLVNMGNLALAAGEPARAEDYYSQALAIDPGYVNGLNGMGLVCYQRQDYATASGYFQDALQRSREHPEALNNLGLCSARLGRLDEAIEYFRRALRARPAYRDAQRNLEVAIGTRAGR